MERSNNLQVDDSDIVFSEHFSVEDLQKLQDQFANATGVASLITTPDGVAITAPSNFCRLCRDVIRGTEIGLKNCQKSDAVLGAPSESGPTICRCLSGGLWDAGASITVGGKHVANWLIGQVRNEGMDEDKILNYASEIGADPSAFREAFAEVPVMSKERFDHVAQMLFTFARELSSCASQNLQQKQIIAKCERTDEELRGSERHYRLLFDNMIDGFAVHEIVRDASGAPIDYRFLAINPEFEKITGLEAESVIGRTVREIMPGLEPYWIDRYGQVAVTGEPIEFEERSGPLGRDFHVRAFRPEPGRFAVIFKDITAHKASEARIHRLTQLYAALSQCNQAIVRCDNSEELFPEVCRIAVEYGGMPMAWIGLLDEETLRVCPAVSFGEGAGYLKTVELSADAAHPGGRGPTGRAVREDAPVWCLDFQNDPCTAPWHRDAVKFGWTASCSIPLHVDGRVVGVLGLLSANSDLFDAEAMALLEEMANDISFAITGFDREAKRRKAEESLLETEQLLQAAMDNSEAGIAIADAPTGVLRYFNKAGLQILGASEDDAMQDMDIRKYISTWQLLDLNGAPLATEDVPLARAVLHGEKCSREFVIRRPDNEERTVWSSASPIYDRAGALKAAMVVFHDTTERRRDEEELLVLRTGIEQSANSIVITDVRGNIEYANAAFEKSTGYTAAEAIGQNPRILNSGEHSADFYRNLWETILAGNSWQGEFHNKRKDGSLYWDSALISPIRDEDGQILHFIAIKEDVTGRKAMETNLRVALDRAESAASAKSAFLAMMSHELRTPLNGVLGFAELLSGTALDDEQIEFVQTIRDSGTHLLDVVNDILDYSSLENGRLSIDAAPMNLQDLVESSCKMVRQAAKSKGLEFRSTVAPDVPNVIAGDARRIRQILINLLGNAVKFTRQGSVALEVAQSRIGDHLGIDFRSWIPVPGFPMNFV